MFCLYLPTFKNQPKILLHDLLRSMKCERKVTDVPLGGSLRSRCAFCHFPFPCLSNWRSICGDGISVSLGSVSLSKQNIQWANLLWIHKCEREVNVVVLSPRDVWSPFLQQTLAHSGGYSPYSPAACGRELSFPSAVRCVSLLCSPLSPANRESHLFPSRVEASFALSTVFPLFKVKKMEVLFGSVQGRGAQLGVWCSERHWEFASGLVFTGVSP